MSKLTSTCGMPRGQADTVQPELAEQHVVAAMERSPGRP